MELIEKKDIRKKLVENPTLLKSTIKENPALLEYVLSNAEIKRKYVKIMMEDQENLKRLAHNTGISEGTLIGIAIPTFLHILKTDVL